MSNILSKTPRKSITLLYFIFYKTKIKTAWCESCLHLAQEKNLLKGNIKSQFNLKPAFVNLESVGEENKLRK